MSKERSVGRIAIRQKAFMPVMPDRTIGKRFSPNSYLPRPINEIAVIRPSSSELTTYHQPENKTTVIQLVDPFPSFPSVETRPRPTPERRNLNIHELSHERVARLLGKQYESYIELFASGSSAGRTYIPGITNGEDLKIIAAASSHHKIVKPEGTGHDLFTIDYVAARHGGINRHIAKQIAAHILDSNYTDAEFDRVGDMMTVKDRWTSREIDLLFEKARYELKLEELLGQGRSIEVVADETVEVIFDEQALPLGFENFVGGIIDDRMNGATEATLVRGGVIRRYCQCGGCNEFTEDNHLCPAAKQPAVQKPTRIEELKKRRQQKPVLDIEQDWKPQESVESNALKKSMHKSSFWGTPQSGVTPESVKSTRQFWSSQNDEMQKRQEALLTEEKLAA